MTRTKLRDHVKTVLNKVTCEICHEIKYNWYFLKRHKALALPRNDSVPFVHWFSGKILNTILDFIT